MIETAVSVGMFDGVHRGHQALVAELRDNAVACGLSTCVITFANHPLRSICPDRAPRILTTCLQKEKYLRQAGADDVIALEFDEKLRSLTAEQFMQAMADRYGVKLWLMGFNHRFGSDGLRHISDYVGIGRKLGIDVRLARSEVLNASSEPVSSSLVRASLTQGRVADANKMLGREFSIMGTVEAGKQIGRTIGFPTANVKPLISDQMIPQSGVYACTAHIGATKWPAMTNIGCRPTLGQGLAPTIETHLIGYDGNLYGSPIEVKFKERLRDEQKFPTLAALRHQLQSDLTACLTLHP